MKVVLLTNTLTPYRIPLYATINRLAPFDFEVWLTAPQYALRPWGKEVGSKQTFKTLFLHGLTWHKGERYIPFNPGLTFHLTRKRPEIVITGGFSIPTLIAGLYCQAFRKKLIIWSGVTFYTERGISLFREGLRKALVRRADAFIAYGNLAKDYLCFLGAPEGCVFLSYNTVDVAFFTEQSTKWRMRREELKKEWELPAVVILYVGQLIPRKGVEHLLQSVLPLQREGHEVGVLLVGRGESKPNLRAMSQNLGLNWVLFAGFKPKEELPKYYAVADIFVLPSLDVWGLVVNEAMACGLPVVCSQTAGASEDLIKPGVNGYIVDPTVHHQLTAALRELILKPEVRLEMGHNAQKTIGQFTIEQAAQGFMQAISRVKP